MFLVSSLLIVDSLTRIIFAIELWFCPAAFNASIWYLELGWAENSFCHCNTNLGFQFHPPSRDSPVGGMKPMCFTYYLNLQIQISVFLFKPLYSSKIGRPNYKKNGIRRIHSNNTCGAHSPKLAYHLLQHRGFYSDAMLFFRRILQTVLIIDLYYPLVLSFQ